MSVMNFNSFKKETLIEIILYQKKIIDELQIEISSLQDSGSDREVLWDWDKFWRFDSYEP